MSSFEIAHYDVRSRRKDQIMILGQDEQEKDAKNRTSTNSASDLTNPLEVVKQSIQAWESLNSDVRARS